MAEEKWVDWEPTEMPKGAESGEEPNVDYKPPPAADPRARKIPRTFMQWGGETAQNFLPDAKDQAVETLKAVADPGGTVKKMGRLAMGGLDAGARGMFGGNAPIQQNEAMFNENIAGPLGEYIKDPSKILDYIREHPAHALSLFAPAGAGAASKIAKVAGLPRVANTLSTAGRLSNIPATTVSAPINFLRWLLKKTGLPETMLNSVMKYPPQTVSQLERRGLNRDILDQRTPVNTKTFDKISSQIASLDKSIDQVLKDMSKEGLSQGTNIDINQAMGTLNRLKENYRKMGKPDEYFQIIDEVKRTYAEHPYIKRTQAERPINVYDPSKPVTERTSPSMETVNVPTGQASIWDANQLKKGIYQELERFYQRKEGTMSSKAGVANDTEAVAKSRLATAIRREIINSPDLPPEVKAMMKKEAALMHIKPWIERAINRTGNYDISRLPSMLFGVLTDAGVPGAIAHRWAFSPGVMSRMAIYLEHGGSKTAQTARKFGSRGVPAALSKEREIEDRANE